MRSTEALKMSRCRRNHRADNGLSTRLSDLPIADVCSSRGVPPSHQANGSDHGPASAEVPLCLPGTVPSVLSREFKAEHGLSHSSYILQRRLQRAMNLLKNSREPVSGVAGECGFSNPDYFSRFFKEKTGYRPCEFRKED